MVLRGGEPRQSACKHCGESFPAGSAGRGWRKYCSFDCYNAARRNPERVAKPCPVCGETYDPTAHLRTTCGKRECVNEAKSRSKRGDRNPMRRPQVVAKVQAGLADAREALLNGLEPIAPRREVCERPGCTNLLVGQAQTYCSPACHYADRKRVGRRTERHRRVDFTDHYRACRVPGCGNPGVHVHHVVYRQHVLRADGDIWHPDNALRLCVEHHGNAHGHRRLPVSVLRDENFSFAVSLLGDAGLDYLRRYYENDGDPRLIELEREAA